ncbi:MAG: hypothetical protein ACOVRP_12485, partial [Gemmatimonas sp.]
AELFGLLSTPALNGAASVDVAVPNQAALLGLELVAQSLGLSTANAAGIATSNGIDATVGR